MLFALDRKSNLLGMSMSQLIVLAFLAIITTLLLCWLGSLLPAMLVRGVDYFLCNREQAKSWMDRSTKRIEDNKSDQAIIFNNAGEINRYLPHLKTRLEEQRAERPPYCLSELQLAVTHKLYIEYEFFYRTSNGDFSLNYDDFLEADKLVLDAEEKFNKNWALAVYP